MFVKWLAKDRSRTETYTVPGIVHQARVPSHYVLLLPVQHDRRPHPRRITITGRKRTIRKQTGPTIAGFSSLPYFSPIPRAAEGLAGLPGKFLLGSCQGLGKKKEEYNVCHEVLQ